MLSSAEFQIALGAFITAVSTAPSLSLAFFSYWARPTWFFIGTRLAVDCLSLPIVFLGIVMMASALERAFPHSIGRVPGTLIAGAIAVTASLFERSLAISAGLEVKRHRDAAREPPLRPSFLALVLYGGVLSARAVNRISLLLIPAFWLNFEKA